MPARQQATFSWTYVTAASYLPTMLIGMVLGIITPIEVLRAQELGAGLSTAAFIVGLAAVGRLVGTIPAGSLIDRIGERRVLVAAGFLEALTLLAVAFAPHLAMMGAALFVSGLFSAAHFIARQGFMIDIMPTHAMARGMSLLGGSLRAGMLIGPLIGALAVTIGGLRAAFLVAAAAAAIVSLIMWVLPEPAASAAGHRNRKTVRAVDMVLARRRTFLTTGTTVLMISMLRESRSVLVPLWAAHIGLDGVQTSLVFAVAALVELAVVYPSGVMMDRYGRAWSGAAMTVVCSAALMMLPLTGSQLWLSMVTTLLGFGNGLSSGYVMTLGADEAPDDGRATFLGIWRSLGEVGHVGVPLGSAGFIAVGGPALACVIAGVTGLASAWWTWHWVSDLDRRRTRT